MNVSNKDRAIRVALLDTTIQVDRWKTGGRGRYIEKTLTAFDRWVATSICLLEFKATLIQQCITIHDQLQRRKLFTAVRDALLEKKHPQARLRAHIFNNLINVLPCSSHDITDDKDRRLAEQACLQLGRTIPKLYGWFVTESVHQLVADGIQCSRAQEAPRKTGVAFGVNLPQCHRGKNKTCDVEQFIRENAEPFVGSLGRIIQDSGEDECVQLRRAYHLFQEVLGDSSRELTHSECRSAGDCLIAMEGFRHASHVLSSNPSEWEPLSEIVGLTHVKMEYPDERTL